MTASTAPVSPVPLTARRAALWQQVEKSVLLAPYWLDGHCLSAQTALRLGYKQVADTIRDEVMNRPGNPGD
ncbi:type VI secretion system domain-containing protein [Escherichia coli]|uniref:type VI secretion system domain-containing protein n=1 Tax=Escherichia coli TaxID=562 RepID=UPI000A70FA40